MDGATTAHDTVARIRNPTTQADGKVQERSLRPSPTNCLRTIHGSRAPNDYSRESGPRIFREFCHIELEGPEPAIRGNNAVPQLYHIGSCAPCAPHTDLVRVLPFWVGEWASHSNRAGGRRFRGKQDGAGRNWATRKKSLLSKSMKLTLKSTKKSCPKYLRSTRRSQRGH